MAVNNPEKLVKSSSLINEKSKHSKQESNILERMFIAYRSLVILLFNFAQSGHPGGSISTGRLMLNLTFNKNNKMDIADLSRGDSDIIGLAAGHKALGLYSYLGLLFEIIKLKNKKLFDSIEHKIRFEDLLGFRKNSATITPLMKKFGSRRLDGHPTPETPGVMLATGVSGVGFGAFGGYALAKNEYYENPPIVNIIEGEGGMTPGRVHENLAHFWALSLWNLIIHVDWNNVSIDADKVCSEDGCLGQYVNWSPYDLGLLHGHNVVCAENGCDNDHIKVSQDYVFEKTLAEKHAPNMIVYRTIKGEGYMDGRKSHGAGYKMDSDEYFKTQKIFEDTFNIKFIRVPPGVSPEIKEEYFYKNLLVVEKALEADEQLLDFSYNGLMASRDALEKSNRKPKKNAARVSVIFEKSDTLDIKSPPKEILYKAGTSVTLRESLGNTLHHLNKISGGGLYGFAADLAGSTSLNLMCEDFQKKGFRSRENPYAKIVPAGICEDGGTSLISGISATGHYIGVGSSYATFISPMGFTAARLYCIAFQAKHGNMAPMLVVNTHAGLKTGEDGPTHACPQTLSIWKSFNKLKWKVITITPWDPNEIWPLMISSLKTHPAVIVPFVIRPPETVIDRKKYGFPDVTETTNGIYAVRRAKKNKATIVYQGAEVGVELPKVVVALEKDNIDVNIFYISSSELFSYLPESKQYEIFPSEFRKNAMAVTGFTIDTMYEYLLSEKGRELSLHPFKNGIFLGSGPGEEVLKQAGLDVNSQIEAIKKFALETT